jgi:hypothetical protein
MRIYVLAILIMPSRYDCYVFSQFTVVVHYRPYPGSPVTVSMHLCKTSKTSDM